MRLIVQRCQSASVVIDGIIKREIDKGMVVLLGVEETDGKDDMDWMIRKLKGLRIFSDENGLMNLSILDIEGDILLISQFTLFASTKKGNRPSFLRSAKPLKSEPVYNEFIKILSRELPDLKIETGVFGADMKVSLINDGPVTIMIDSKLRE